MKSTAGSTVRGPSRVPWKRGRTRAAVPTVAAAMAVVARPRLWRAAGALLPPGWWKRWPPLPAPPPAYRRFRSETMYGDGDAPVTAEDLVAYLEWCRGMRRRAR